MRGGEGARYGQHRDDRPGPGRHVDEPQLPDDVRAADLDRAARSELRTLSKENADAVARHLVMAGRLIDDDAAEAHRHALAAARRAGRVAVVRESVAITAYAVGDFALALRELRTFRRISGSDDQIGLMVDSERGVGRPDRALELGRSVERERLPVEAQVALAVAMSGARLDLGDPQGALDELERVPADLQRVHPWTPTLFEALAAVHEDLGDAETAATWSRRADRAADLLEEVDEEATSVVVDTEAGAEDDESGDGETEDGDADQDASALDLDEPEAPTDGLEAGTTGAPAGSDPEGAEPETGEPDGVVDSSVESVESVTSAGADAVEEPVDPAEAGPEPRHDGAAQSSEDARHGTSD